MVVAPAFADSSSETPPERAMISASFGLKNVSGYVDNCFVLREKKYIYRDVVGLLCLTQYAKAHIAECYLTFAIRHKKSRDATRYAAV